MATASGGGQANSGQKPNQDDQLHGPTGTGFPGSEPGTRPAGAALGAPVVNGAFDGGQAPSPTVAVDSGDTGQAGQVPSGSGVLDGGDAVTGMGQGHAGQLLSPELDERHERGAVRWLAQTGRSRPAPPGLLLAAQS